MTCNVFYLYYLKKYERTNMHMSTHLYVDSMVHCYIDYIYILYNEYLMKKSNIIYCYNFNKMININII